MVRVKYRKYFFYVKAIIQLKNNKFLRENNYSSESFVPNGVLLAPVLKLRGFCQLLRGAPRPPLLPRPPPDEPRVEGWSQFRAMCPTVLQL